MDRKEQMKKARDARQLNMKNNKEKFITKANKKLTPIKAIRAKCIDCMCFQPSEVKRCPSTDCPLYIYRMGHRPKSQDSTGDKNTIAS